MPWSRGSTTGPSPDARDGLSAGAIIVILVAGMVAVTAVSAVIIYSTISGLTPSTTGWHVAASMQVTATAGPSSSPASFYVQLSLATSQPLSPNQFALKVTNSTGLAAVIAASPSCVGGAQATQANCTAGGSGWYAVLVGSSGSVLATYSFGQGDPIWTNEIDGTLSEPIATGDYLLVVSHVILSSAGYVLTAFGTVDWGVSGSVRL